MAMVAIMSLLLFTVLVSPALAQPKGGPKRNAPEIDPSSAASGIALLAGSLVLLAGMRRAKRA
jgi:hypothetical protein